MPGAHSFGAVAGGRSRVAKGFCRAADHFCAVAEGFCIVAESFCAVAKGPGAGAEHPCTGADGFRAWAGRNSPRAGDYAACAVDRKASDGLRPTKSAFESIQATSPAECVACPP
jgi:hypothetical protein